jgi:thiosulfate/3-mercaptopyruvate sulfurtransferase
VAVEFVDAAWVVDRIGDPHVRLVDPRRTMRYLRGHLPGAINVPATRAFDDSGRLRPETDLAAWLGEAGVGTDTTVVVYDGYDGQFGAMMAWLLDYLGHPDVRFLELVFDDWVATGGELFYRPVAAEPAAFASSPRPERRAAWRDLLAEPVAQLVDTRSESEFADERGHIPGARHVAWTNFVQPHDTLFRPDGDVAATLRAAAIDPSRPVITYCRVGMRAAVAAIALGRLGYTVRLYDGSFEDWTRRGLEVAVSPAAQTGQAM